MRIITANLNGIRSAASKGFFEWAGEQQADVIGVQEVKARAKASKEVLKILRRYNIV